jgi:uncharacterized membrane protein
MNFLWFLDSLLSRCIAQVLSEWFWVGSSCPYYYWFIIIIIIIIIIIFIFIVVFFFFALVQDSDVSGIAEIISPALKE